MAGFRQHGGEMQMVPGTSTDLNQDSTVASGHSTGSERISIDILTDLAPAGNIKLWSEHGSDKSA